MMLNTHPSRNMFAIRWVAAMACALTSSTSVAQAVVDESQAVAQGKASQTGEPTSDASDRAADPIQSKRESAEKHFDADVKPFIKKYCLDCHSNRRPTEAGINFMPALKDPGHAAFNKTWKKAGANVKAHDMPPQYMDDQPTEEERQKFSDWISEVKFLSEKDPGAFIIRRLTKTEYGNTLQDLFGVSPETAQNLPDEVSGEGYLNSLSPLQLEQYLSIADKVLNKVFSATDSPRTGLLTQLLVESPSTADDEITAARDVAISLARLAYRRPATEKEIDVLVEVFELGKENDLAYREAVRLMVKAVLVSPQFLFITPAETSTTTDSTANDSIAPLDDHQLASRLSYLIWATMPDSELMGLADRGTLHEGETLTAQVRRLLDDPRSRALFDGFGSQWLGINRLEDKVFDPIEFPQMTAEIRLAMYDEARLFFESVVRENHSIAKFIDCNYTFLNESLAEIYGLGKTVTGPEMRRVQLSSGNRGGILAMPATLAATSFPNRTSPVKRGVWVLEQVLGEHVPSAPPNVPELEQQNEETVANLTLRERTELHRTTTVCANCHELLDPLGFGLENFDAIGRWRDADDNGEPIDAGGALPGGKPFSGPKELKAVLAERTDDIARNLLQRLLAYALCRSLEGYDEVVVDELMQSIADDDYRMQSLITSVVTSYPFTHRRLEEASD